MPGRREPLLPRLDPVPGEVEDDQDSVIAETIAVSSDEDRVVEQPAVPSLPDRLRGPANIRPSSHSASP